METVNGFWRITFDTNPDDCNLRCIMCEDHSPYSNTQRNRIKSHLPKRRMPVELIERVITQAKSLGIKEIIPSTMGEPLLYKHFLDILNLCQQHDMKLNLTTNGTFPIKGATEWAKLIVPITTDVKISWNGATKATQEKIMLGTQWENVLNNIKDFIKIRNDYSINKINNYCRVTLQLTFLEDNVNELADIVALGIDLGIDRIKGHHLWDHFAEIKNQSLRRNASAIERWNSAVEKAQAVAQQKALPNGKFILLENIYPLTKEDHFKPNESDVCPFLGKEIWVASDGRFNPCCAPDQERRELGDFGNLHEKSLTDILLSDQYQTLKENYQQQGVCQRCNMRKPQH